MIRAYPEFYLDYAMKNLGEAFDYAVNACGFDSDWFMDRFIATGYADAFGRGTPKVISGISGTELVMDVIDKAGMKFDFPPAQVDYDYSPDYWSGWILAYYQWKTSRSFKDIHSKISMKEIRNLYYPLHEAHEDKFVTVINDIMRRKEAPSRLQNERKFRGYTQKELAEKAGVNLRTLQEYESKSKNINKASVSIVISLSRSLGCKIEDILEYLDDEN